MSPTHRTLPDCDPALPGVHNSLEDVCRNPHQGALLLSMRQSHPWNEVLKGIIGAHAASSPSSSLSSLMPGTGGRRPRPPSPRPAPGS